MRKLHFQGRRGLLAAVFLVLLSMLVGAACVGPPAPDVEEPQTGENQDALLPLTSGYLPWEGSALTGGFVWADYVVVFSKDRFWKLRLSDKALLDSGMLQDKEPWKSATPVEGKRPWDDHGITAAWTSGSLVGIVSRGRYWTFDPALYTWKATPTCNCGTFDALPDTHMFKKQDDIPAADWQELGCHASWKGAGLTGGWSRAGGTQFVTISKDRYWVQNSTAPYAVLSAGKLGWTSYSDLFASAPPQVDGRGPWEGEGITATWVNGNSLGISSADRYWTYDMGTGTWVGSGRYDQLPSTHLFKQNVTPIAAGSACTAGTRTCSGNTVVLCTRDRQQEALLACGAGYTCASGACQNNSGKHAETTALDLDSVSKVTAYFSTSQYDWTFAHALPPGASFDAATKTLTLSQKGGVVLAVPNPSAALYRVEMEMEDTLSCDLTGFMTLIDQKWQPGLSVRGISVGINSAAGTPTATYTAKTTDFSGGSDPAFSRFGKRRTGWIPQHVYVTPAGAYPVIDGGNYASLPDLAGSGTGGTYTLSPPAAGAPPLTYIVLGKWETGPTPLRVRNIRVVTLQDSGANALDVSGHFLKKAAESDALVRFVGDRAYQRGVTGMHRTLWAALLYRLYDYRFGDTAANQAKIRSLVDAFNFEHAGFAEGNLARLGCQDTTSVNHSYINESNWHPYAFWALEDRLTSSQITSAKTRFADTAAALMAHIDTTGEYPKSQNACCDETFRGDTFAEEVSWDIAYLTGYYALLDPAQESAKRSQVWDYLTWLGFHHLSDGRSVAAVYPNLSFPSLPAPPAGAPAWRDFESKYTWGVPGNPQRYLIDNHGFHPSVNYSWGVTGAAFDARNALQKIDSTAPVTLSANLGYAWNNLWSRFDLPRLRDGNVDRFTDETCEENTADPAAETVQTRASQAECAVSPDVAAGYASYCLLTGGACGGTFVQAFSGRTNPSGVEDWGTTYPTFSVTEASVSPGGDYTNANAHARRAYLLYFSGAGLLFCNPGPRECSFGDQDLLQYQRTFGNAIFALLFSNRTTFR